MKQCEPLKEPSIEEKAKRYDEAIERAKSLIDFCSDSEFKTLEYVFHELKKSENENIKSCVEMCLTDADKSLEQAFGVLSREIKLEFALKLVEYADKFANATFITRWYWMRKMKKFVKGINVIKEL